MYSASASKQLARQPLGRDGQNSLFSHNLSLLSKFLFFSFCAFHSHQLQDTSAILFSLSLSLLNYIYYQILCSK